MQLIDTTPTHYLLDLDGRRVSYPRVTSVLKPVHSFEGIPLDVLARAAERGTAVHRAVWLLEGGGDGSGLDFGSLSEEVKPYVQAYQAAKAALRFRVVEKERLVVSQRYGFAGRADLVVEGITPGLCIPDLKTGMEDPSHALQLAAYVEGYKETVSTKRSIGRRILYLRGDGTYRLVDVPLHQHARDWQTFLALLSVYRWQEAVGRQAA